MRNYLILGFLLISSMFAFGKSPLIDPKATKETVILYNNLKKLAPRKMMYGQYRAYTSGKYKSSKPKWSDSSDCKKATGSHPAIVEIGLGQTYLWSTTDKKAAFNKIVRDVHKRGGVISVGWHMKNPVTGGGYNDVSPGTVTEILKKNSKARIEFEKKLKDAALFLKSLKDEKGKLIPVLFRPFHEQLHNGFWWGKGNCTKEEYITLWKGTVHFMRDKMGVHNLIWVFSPNKPLTKEIYESRHPGYDYMDILGFDYYWDGVFPEPALKCARVVSELAKEHNKVAAITEMGVRKGLHKDVPSDWYSQQLLNNIKKDPVGKNVAYYITWFGRPKNAGKKESNNWSVYKDEKSTAHLYADFMKFYRDEWTVFENNIPNMYK